jgi:hypothetical protein
MNRTTKEKADLLKMLAEAVRNTPGAVQVGPTHDTTPERKPKRVAKIKSVRVPSGRKQGRR